MNDGICFGSSRELWGHLVAGGKIRRRYESVNPKIVFLNAEGNLETSFGEEVSYIAEFSKWVVHSPKLSVKVIAYRKVENRWQPNQNMRHRLEERGLAIRDLGQVVFTMEGSPDHEALEVSSEFARAESLDPKSGK